MYPPRPEIKQGSSRPGPRKRGTTNSAPPVKPKPLALSPRWRRVRLWFRLQAETVKSAYRTVPMSFFSHGTLASNASVAPPTHSA